MRLLKAQKGFSLVEALVTSSIAVIISVVLYVLLSSSTSFMKHTTEKLRLQQIADILQREIQISVRNSDKVFSLPAYNSFSTSGQINSDSLASKSMVIFLNTATATEPERWTAMAVSDDGVLRVQSGLNYAELAANSDANNWTAFSVAGKQVYLGNLSPFAMTWMWEGLVADLQSIQLQSASTDRLPLVQTITRCSYH